MRNERLLRLSVVREIPVSDLRTQSRGWILDGKAAGLSPRTLEAREDVLARLLWFLESRHYESCDVTALRDFMAHATLGHLEPGGRWDNPKLTDPLRPASVSLFHRNIRTLFRFLVGEGRLDMSPMESVSRPMVRDDQIQPFTLEELARLKRAARDTGALRWRNEFIFYLLLDTGIRASELCALTVGAVNLDSRQVIVTGKGNKRRALHLGDHAMRALWQYVRFHSDPDEPLFHAQRGHRAGEALTYSGLLQLVRRWGRKAGVTGAHPHRFRHTAAVMFLRSGGHVYGLRAMLGHSSLAIVQRYVALSEADLSEQHAKHSPGDQLGRRKR